MMYKNKICKQEINVKKSLLKIELYARIYNFYIIKLFYICNYYNRKLKL